MSFPDLKPDRKTQFEFEEFSLDPVRRRLFRRGEPVAVTPKAVAILIALVERRGQVVDKEELIQKVWPNTFVTEANLTQNISALRKALGEKAGDSRFVITVPGRGYSFVSEVSEVLRDSTGEIPIVILPHDEPVEPAADDPWRHQAPEAASRETAETAPVPVPRSRSRWLGVGLALVAVAMVASSYLIFRPRPRLAGTGEAAIDRPAVAVLDFRNLSGRPEDNWLSTAFAEMLITELATGSRVRVISAESAARASETLSEPRGELLAGQELERLREVLGADQVVVGSFLALGPEGNGQIRLDLRVQRLPGGETVASMSEVGFQSDLFTLVTNSGTRLRKALGWIEPTADQIRAAKARLPTATQAQKSYSEGLERMRAYDFAAARDHLERALASEPTSAAIHSALARTYAELGRDALAAREAREALELAAPLPQQDRLAIEAFYREAIREWSRATELYRSLWTFFPDELEYGLQLAKCLSIEGRGNEALVTLKELRELPPPARDDVRIDLMEAQIARRLTDRSQEQLAAARRAAVKGRRLAQSQVVAEALVLEGDALFVIGSPKQSLLAFNQARDLFAKAGNQAAVGRTLQRMGAAYITTSDFAAAAKRYAEGLAIAESLGSSELEAAHTAALGFVATFQGDLPQARTHFEAARRRFQDLGDQLYIIRSLYGLGEVAWGEGDTEGARDYLDQVLSLSRQSGTTGEEARALDLLGRLLAAQGTLGEARKQQERAVSLMRGSVDHIFSANFRTSLARTLFLAGDLAQARRLLETSLAAQQRVGDRHGTARTLGLLSDVAHRSGDLAGARKLAEQGLTLARNIEAALLHAEALQRLGRLHLAADQLGDAERALKTAWQLSRDRRAHLLAAEINLDLARVSLSGGDPGQAARRAGEVGTWAAGHKIFDLETSALLVSAQAALARGNLTAAGVSSGKARLQADTSENRGIKIASMTLAGRLEAVQGTAEAAKAHLRWAVEEADKIGCVASSLDVRLALGTVETATADAADSGRGTLLAVQKEAQSKGFKLLARQAAEELAQTKLVTRPLPG